MPYIIEKTFNSEIFTKVGNPTITADGIASGFSTANYLTKTLNINNCTNLKVECVVTVGAKPQNYIFDCLPQVNNLSPLGLRVFNNMYFNFLDTNNAQKTISNTVANIGDTYFASFELQGTNIIATFKNLSTGVEEIKTAVNASPITINEIKLGVARSIAAPWQGSIDLKQFKVTVDGKVVLNGTTSKEVYVLPSIQEIKDYYSNTLTIQYNGKPKAKATIEMLVDLIYDDVILNQIQEAFDWKTAVGKQLDIIGQWVGVSRVYQQSGISGKTYLSYPGWDDETDTLQHGYSDYTTFNSNTGNDLTYKELNTLEANLNDDDYRTVIGLKIIKNNINHTAKNIDDAIWEYFNGKVYTTWSDYKITYHYPAKLTTIIEVCNAKNVLLAPIGVNINLLQTE